MEINGRKMDAAWKKAISDGKKKLGIGGNGLGKAAVAAGGAVAAGLVAKKLGPVVSRKLTTMALDKSLAKATGLKTVAAATAKSKDTVVNSVRKPADIKASMRRESKQRAAKAKFKNV